MLNFGNFVLETRCVTLSPTLSRARLLFTTSLSGAGEGVVRAIRGLLPLCLTACTLAPTHPASDLTPPKTTRIGIKIAQQASDLSHMQWWEKMHDPSLNRLIKTALANNNQLKTAQANILQAQAKLQESRFAWLPTLSASGNAFVGGGWDSQFTPEGTLAQSQLLSKTGIIHFKGYYAGFVPKYSLNILQNRYNDKFYEASLAMQRSLEQSARLSVISQVSGAYFMLLGQQEQRREQRQLIHDLKKMRQLESVRYRSGASDLSTLTNLDQQIAANEGSLPDIENSIAQNENAIQVLLNRNPAPIVSRSRINTLSVRGLIPSQLPSAVLKNRPDIIAAMENLNMSKATIGIAYSNFFPTIPLTGLLGGASFELSHLLKLSTGLWVADAAASMPLLNGADYAQIKAAKAGYNATYFTYIQTLKAAFADVDNSLTNQQKMNAALSYQVKALQAYQRGYTLALARYKAGAKDERDLVTAQVNVDSARLAVNLAKMQQLDSIVQVYQSLAGGAAGS
ncbi:MAG: TolC family protein [Gammaproteobacteria bacterium]|nr:TolC family protein [Gammaproteobacteria bacterium]